MLCLFLNVRASLTKWILCFDGFVSLQRLGLPKFVDGGDPEVVLLSLLKAVNIKEEWELVTSAFSFLDPLLSLGTQHLNVVLLDRLPAIVNGRLPTELAALGGDVGDLEWPLGAGGAAQDHQLHPLLIKPILIFSFHLVLAVVPTDGVFDFKNGVIVLVNDLYPGMLLGDERLSLVAEDEALALGPGLLRDRLSDNVDGPAVALADLDCGDLEIISHQPGLHCNTRNTRQKLSQNW